MAMMARDAGAEGGGAGPEMVARTAPMATSPQPEGDLRPATGPESAPGTERCAGATDSDDAAALDSDDERGPVRRCIVTSIRQSPAVMLRFVRAPDGTVVPDLAETLPGRGVWMALAPGRLAEAERKGVFSRAFRGAAPLAPGLADRLPELCVRRCVELLGLLRRSGLAVAGFEKVRDRLGGPGLRGSRRAAAPATAFLLEADDGAAEGREELARLLAPGTGIRTGLSAAEIGMAFGRDRAVHVWIGRAPLADRLGRDLDRLRALRGDSPAKLPMAAAPDVH